MKTWLAWSTVAAVVPLSPGGRERQPAEKVVFEEKFKGRAGQEWSGCAKTQGVAARPVRLVLRNAAGLYLAHATSNNRRSVLLRACRVGPKRGSRGRSRSACQPKDARLAVVRARPGRVGTWTTTNYVSLQEDGPARVEMQMVIEKEAKPRFPRSKN